MDLKALADLTNLDTVEDAEKALDEDDNEVDYKQILSISR